MDTLSVIRTAAKRGAEKKKERGWKQQRKSLVFQFSFFLSLGRMQALDCKCCLGVDFLLIHCGSLKLDPLVTKFLQWEGWLSLWSQVSVTEERLHPEQKHDPLAKTLDSIFRHWQCALCQSIIGCLCNRTCNQTNSRYMNACAAIDRVMQNSGISFCYHSPIKHMHDVVGNSFCNGLHLCWLCGLANPPEHMLQWSKQALCVLWSSFFRDRWSSLVWTC